jgi:hypothetical protein
LQDRARTSAAAAQPSNASSAASSAGSQPKRAWINGSSRASLPPPDRSATSREAAAPCRRKPRARCRHRPRRRGRPEAAVVALMAFAASAKKLLLRRREGRCGVGCGDRIWPLQNAHRPPTPSRPPDACLTSSLFFHPC